MLRNVDQYKNTMISNTLKTTKWKKVNDLQTITSTSLYN